MYRDKVASGVLKVLAPQDSINIKCSLGRAGVAALAILEVSRGDATPYQGDEHPFAHPTSLLMSSPIQFSYTA